MSSIRHCHPLLLGMILFVLCSTVHAATKIVLIEPEAGDTVLHNALVRLRGELTAVGFEVETGPGPDHNPRWELEQASGRDTLVAITLRRSEDNKAVDVWVLDRLTGKTLIRRVNVEISEPNAPVVLAVRTTELLRASLLEVENPAPPSPLPEVPVLHLETAPPVVTRWLASRVTPMYARWDVDVGMAVSFSPGVGANVLPVLRVGRGISAGFAVRLTLGSSVISQQLARPTGNVLFDHQLAEVELLYALFPQNVIVPTITLGAGVLRTGISGHSNVPEYVGVNADRASALLSAGLGLLARLGPRIALLLDAQMFFALPAVQVEIGPDVVGVVGLPSLLSGLHGVIWL